MFARKLVVSCLVLGLLTPAALVACNSGPVVQHANVKPGAMPEKGEWSGVYYSPLYGYLHLLVDGKVAQGAWRTAAGDAWGELHGEVDGNLMKYSWVEHKIGMVGKDATREGKGYFVYTIPKEGEAHHIVGEWGLDQSEAGNSWEAVKQLNMPPNPASVKPDEIEGRVNVGGWDTDQNSGDKPADDSKPLE